MLWNKKSKVAIGYLKYAILTYVEKKSLLF